MDMINDVQDIGHLQVRSCRWNAGYKHLKCRQLVSKCSLGLK